MRERIENGYTRSECACKSCVEFCRRMPGFLLPDDLPYFLKPAGRCQFFVDNLLVSPGALVMRDGLIFRIPTLVPAAKPDGSCIHLTADSKCAVWENAPFGCAFFDDHQSPERSDVLAAYGLRRVLSAWRDPNALYPKVWRWLWQFNKRAEGPEVKRAAIVNKKRRELLVSMERGL